MPARMQDGTDPTGAATGIQNARTARHHGVDQAGFAAEIGTFGGKRANAFDVRLRVVGVSVGEPARGCHPLRVAKVKAARPSTMAPAPAPM